MSVEKLGANFLNSLFSKTKTVALKLNETIDGLNAATDGTETFANITVTSVSTLTTVNTSGVATFSNAAGITTNTITERTAAAGITADGVLLKDSSIALADGLVSNLAIKIGADFNNGIYGISDTQLGFAVEGTLVGGFNTTGLFTDVISEQTSTLGVTVDGVLLKDSTVVLGNGTVALPAVGIGSNDTGFYRSGGGAFVSTIAGVANAIFNAAGIAVNTVAERTTDAGVTIDGLLLKDGGIASDALVVPLVPTTLFQSITGAGAVNITAYATYITTTAGNAFTLANSTKIGQVKRIELVVDGGDATITPTSYADGTTIVLAAVGDFVVLLWNGTAWRTIEIGGTATINL